MGYVGARVGSVGGKSCSLLLCWSLDIELQRVLIVRTKNRRNQAKHLRPNPAMISTVKLTQKKLRLFRIYFMS